MSRRGSVLRKIGALGKVEIDENGEVSIPLPPNLLRGQSDATSRWQNKRRAANADWDCSSNRSSFSGGSQITKKARNDSNTSLSMVDLRRDCNNPSNSSKPPMNASARLLQLVGDDPSKVGGNNRKKRRCHY